MRRGILGSSGAILAALLLGGYAGTPQPVLAQNPRVTPNTVTPEQVRKAIDSGVEFLRKNQSKGNWEEHVPPFGNRFKGGVTALAVLALLESGADPETDASVREGLRELRKMETQDIYSLSLQTMAFARANLKEDRARLQASVQNLIKGMRYDNRKRFTGYAYTLDGGGPAGGRFEGDNSNTQYGVLALHFASEAGIPIDDQVWKDILDLYKRTQTARGGWPYRNDNQRGELLTMTTAGVCGLLIAGMKVYRTDEVIREDGTIENCGKRDVDKNLAKGLEWICDNFSIAPRAWQFYNYYGIERAGRLSGMRFFTNDRGKKVDWYREGAAALVNTQNVNGSWGDNRSDVIDSKPVIATSFALLFLSKGRTPVLIHKMVHGRDSARGLGGDWNNDPNDVRNLTDFCSKAVFGKESKPLPLTWQIFDASYVGKETDPTVLQDMLQAPILFLNGHDAPRLTGKEKELIKRFIGEGGFIFAEACCGKEDFDKGFRKLCEELWPKYPLAPLDKGDPIWTAMYPLVDKNGVPMNAFNLHGIKFGCRTGLVYAPKDMSCHWESNMFDPEKAPARTLLAFRTGANIVAYATGMKPPKEKGEKPPVSTERKDVASRCYLDLAQINHRGPDWQPAPRAMQVVKEHLHDEWSIDVVFQRGERGVAAPTTAVSLALPKELAKYKFLYIHGRGELNVPDEHKRNLREHLRQGAAFLFVDAACGDERFHKSFLEFIKTTFPDEAFEDIAEDDPLFADDTIGFPPETFKTLQLRTEKGKPHQPAFPRLQGIRLDPTKKNSPWILIYSRYDVGCALEKHAAADCVGYDHESAVKLTSQIMLYTLKR